MLPSFTTRDCTRARWTLAAITRHTSRSRTGSHLCVDLGRGSGLGNPAWPISELVRDLVDVCLVRFVEVGNSLGVTVAQQAVGVFLRAAPPRDENKCRSPRMANQRLRSLDPRILSCWSNWKCSRTSPNTEQPSPLMSARTSAWTNCVLSWTGEFLPSALRRYWQYSRRHRGPGGAPPRGLQITISFPRGVRLCVPLAGPVAAGSEPCWMVQWVTHRNRNLRSAFCAAAAERAEDHRPILAQLYGYARQRPDTVCVSATAGSELVGVAYGCPWSWAAETDPWSSQLQQRLGPGAAAEIDGSFSVLLFAVHPSASRPGDDPPKRFVGCELALPHLRSMHCLRCQWRGTHE